MEENQKEQLQEELRVTAQRMREYRESGNYDLEVAEHANYNRIASELNELENKSKQENQPSNDDSRKEQLQKELQASAERMREYRASGNYDLEAAEHANYNRIASELNELENKSKQRAEVSSNNENNNSLKWHPKLTKEQIEELIAEGIEPGDNEYRLALYNYGINPDEPVNNGEKDENKPLKWHPKLTKEQIEELIAEGIEPGDNEYRLALYNYGINPDEPVNNGEKNENKPLKWHPKLTKEQIEELIAEGIEPGDNEYRLALYNYGINPDEPVNNGEKDENKPLKWHPKLTKEQIEELIAEGIEPGDNEYRLALYNYGINPDEPVNNGEKNENKPLKWHPKLTKEQIEELIAEGIEPGDNEYRLALYNYGINPDEPVNNGEKDGKVPEPGPTPPTPEPPKPGPAPDPNKLPVRSFWEIYHATCTEHVGTIPRLIYYAANCKIIPPKEEDTLHKVLLTMGGVIGFPLKLFTKPINWALGTNRKMHTMQKNIEELSDAEFQVLVQSPEKVNALFGKQVKDPFDTDYLEPQTMKQYKINNGYLDAVKMRLNKEKGQVISYLNAYAMDLDRKRKALEDVGRENWTPDQLDEYNRTSIMYKQAIKEGKKAAAELAQFEQGAKKKSSGYRNISGWFLAKFNPDNREENARMAELAKERREAAISGDGNKVISITNKMQDFGETNTQLRGTARNHIDIGKYSVESPIEMLNKGKQTKGRLLLSYTALFTSITRFFGQLNIAKENQALIDAHNQHLMDVNKANESINVTGEVPVGNSTLAPDAQEAIARQTVQAGFRNDELGNLEANGFRFNEGYHAGDISVHSDAAQAAQNVQQSLSNGNSLEALKQATSYYSGVQAKHSANIGQYISGHPQFDYSAYTLGSTADMNKIMEFFTNGTVPYNTTVNGVMAQMLDGLKAGVDPTALILSGANLLYQSQKQAMREGNFREQLSHIRSRNQEQDQEQEQEQESNTPGQSAGRNGEGVNNQDPNQERD